MLDTADGDSIPLLAVPTRFCYSRCYIERRPQRPAESRPSGVCFRKCHL